MSVFIEMKPNPAHEQREIMFNLKFKYNLRLLIVFMSAGVLSLSIPFMAFK
jgi:hypothetical protein